LHDVRYVAEQDFISYDCLQAMHHGQKWTKDNIQEEGHRYMATTQEMEIAFSAWPAILERTTEIVDKCHVTFDFNKQLLPKLPVPQGITATTYLRQLCEQNLKKKYPQTTEAAKTRLMHELEVIHSL